MSSSDKLSLLGEVNVLTMDGREALARGDAPLALELLSRKHDLILKIFGPASGSTGTSLIDLSEAFHLNGEFAKARKAIEEALTIYQRLDRTDGQLDRLEESAMQTCARQGHSFEVERIAKARIARLADAGPDRDRERAITQDNLALLYINQRRQVEAVPLLEDSLGIFERLLGQDHADTLVCLKYLSSAYLALEDFEKAEAYARRALACAKTIEGRNSLAAANFADECSVAIGFSARESKSKEKAEEAIALSSWAVRRFEAIEGRHSKDALIGRENNQKLKLMLSAFGLIEKSDEKEDDDGAISIPSYPFISHSYQDKDAVAALRAALPAYCKPIIFEAIKVPPTEFVSEKLISGVLGANGLIFIDSPTSNKSFWTTFERDLAARKRKPMIRFDPETKQLSRHEVQPRKLFLAHVYHPADTADVSKVMRWLIDERSFEAFDDPVTTGDARIPAFAEQQAKQREAFLFSIRSFGAIYLVFLSPQLLADPKLTAHVLEQAEQHPRTTLLCWLERAKGFWPPKEVRRLRKVSKDRSFTFSHRPGHAAFSANELDDLCVRLYWLLYQNPGGMLGAQS